jgi:hypothetical protein
MQSPNQEIRSAREYHERTMHSPHSVRTSGHALDWDIKPLPFKIYPDLPAIPLPRDFPRRRRYLRSAVGRQQRARSISGDWPRSVLLGGRHQTTKYRAGSSAFPRGAVTGALTR